MEAIGTKTEKPGFRMALRVVVNSPNDQTAESHLNNIVEPLLNLAVHTMSSSEVRHFSNIYL